MRTNTDSLWVFALASKYKSYTSINIFLLSVLASALAWFIMSLIYWAHPGGPAWGKYQRMRKKDNSTNQSSSSSSRPSIPGPKGFPIIGSMSLMTGLAHHKLAAMAKACGATRLMALSVGETKVIIASNPSVAKEILNNCVFADRPVKESAYSLMFNRAIGFAPYGVYWTTLRRIAATHLFCPKQIRAFEAQRFSIAHQMVDMFKGQQENVKNIREGLRKASLSNMMGSVFGRTYGLDSEAEDLRKLVDEGYDLLGMFNWSDHLPWLSELDPQGIRARCSNLVPKVNRFVSQIISKHQQNSDKITCDFVDVLLSLQGREKLSESDMVAVLWEMIFRGTDTVAVLIEWVLARMVLHGDVQSRVHEELDTLVGRSRAVMEADISSMVYLPAVLKEVLRLHPPGPLLSWARLAITDTTVDGHHVPAGTTAMVNMWAITRDPLVWEDPLSFKPERFLNEGPELEFSVMGSDLRLAPFGSGRRACPGKALGLTTVTFWVASLLHELEWGLSSDSGVDLLETLKLSCEMANPLVAKVKARRTL
ncbi:Cytochrome P450 family 78 subfamily A polypeptide 6 [Heracleum sosnowskyi]|uniref:Cytochrome P450 family 78 subfamily A polypeptide 6 n=1 Tax=Heracleum sosnowskyi TaxID=360622 RepID=A0AAD8HMH3_9APIA|nr:Cytochrome P450 family 78 subfamily A polypeptide 6 [Heracleum sosnowskyi]